MLAFRKFSTRCGNCTNMLGFARAAWIAALFCAGLSACGGGGSGSSSVISGQQISVVDSDPVQSDRIVEPDRQVEAQTSDLDSFSLYYLEQDALMHVHAPAARGRVQTDRGHGVKVGVLDFGVHTANSAFEDIDIREVYSHSIVNLTRASFSHGTAVASLVAMTAPDAEIISVAVDSPNSNTESFTRNVYDHYTPDELSHFDSRWERHIETALAEEIDILNISIGFDGIISDYIEEDVKQELRSDFGNAIDAMAQASTAEAERAVLVWAAGNAYGIECRQGIPSCVNRGTLLRPDYRIVADHVEVLAGLATLYPDELREHFMAVVAVDTVAVENTNEEAGIAAFSNRCGMAADYCIAAPGVENIFVYFGPESWEYAYDDGSSYAAPIVAGGLALVMGRFSISAKEARRRLFMTANSDGIYAPDAGQDTSAIYGHGLLDLDAATQPVGASSIVLGRSASGPGVSLSSTRLSLGPAFGAASPRSLTGRKVAAFDALAAPFWHDLGALVSVRKPSLSSQIQRMLTNEQPPFNKTHTPWHSVALPGDTRLGLSREKPGYQGLGGPSLVLTWTSLDSPLAFSAFTTEGMDQQPPMTGASIDWKPLGLSAGLLAERASALGAKAEGGFGRLSTSTLFAKLHRGVHAGQWLLGAEAEAGISNPYASHGLLASMRPVVASRFALSASRATGHSESGRIKFSLEQPLRAERARTTLHVPVGRTKNGEVILDRWQADLEPIGRQIDLSAWWSGPDNRYGALRLGTVYSRHPGHDADASPSLSLLAGYRLAF